MGDASVTNRSGEDTTHRDLTGACVTDAGDRITGIAERVTLLIDRPLGGTIPLDAETDAVGASPSVRTLATRVSAVDAATAGAVDMMDDRSADRATVGTDDHAETFDVVDCRSHAVHVGDRV
jgi:hypothetical protein